MTHEPEKFISRAGWGARPRGATVSTHPMGSTFGVTFHYEGPKQGVFPHSACEGKVRGIERFHRDGRGWADVAYSALVCPHGYIYEGRGVGVSVAANGYATVNADWYAVCYLGGVGDGITADGKAGMTAARNWLVRNGAGHAVNGHRDHKATACPGDAIYQWLKTVNWRTALVTPIEEDDMAYRDWPQADKDALAGDVAQAFVDALMEFEVIPRKGIDVRDVLRHGSARQAAKHAAKAEQGSDDDGAQPAPTPAAKGKK